MDNGNIDQLDVGGCGVRFEHRFIQSAPQTLEPGVLYVSIRHKSVLHLCACGCGHEVVTPLAPHRWRMSFNGETVSLEPSVGNSVLPCRSHYFITDNKVDWHRPMTDRAIEWARRRDGRAIDAALGMADQSKSSSISAHEVHTDDGDDPISEGLSSEALGREPATPTKYAVAEGAGWWRRFRRRLRT